MKTANHRSLSARILMTLGWIAMQAGALDPMEGSLVILPGSGLVALGTFLTPVQPRFIKYRVLVFALIAVGVGALWSLSWAGGIGGSTGHSMWWGALILPYLLGWSMGVWGPGSPRWLLVPGILVGLWYQAILVMTLARGGMQHRTAVMIISALGMATIVGCIIRLRRTQIATR